MVDACVIDRVTGEPTPDPVTLVETPTYAVVYTGKCRAQLSDAIAERPVGGEHTTVSARTYIHVPVSMSGLEVGDRVTVTASFDPDLVGRVFLVRSMFHKTHATSRRLECVEVQS